ncbi:MAG: glycosyltransferase 87 family protein [Verrucomicrobiota bacterium]|nr:glycosyltransferase 87 family protein [Verrucomicrobiota bacterium]
MGPFRIVPFLLALAGEFVLFASLNRFDDWTLQEMPVRFVACAIAAGLAFLIATVQFPTWLSVRKQAAIFWAVAIALRLIALPLEPGDDFWRYQWEGKIQQAGFNPYVTAPDDPSLAGMRAHFLEFYKINHRDFRAIYPPGTELLFAGLSRLSSRPLFYKLLFAAADLLTAAILLRLVRRETRFADAAWYAWNPLVVYSFAGAAHFDSLMILPLLAGILCLVRQERATDSRMRWTFALAAAALFGIAISVKLIPLLLLPLAACALRWRAPALLASIGIPAFLSLLYGYPQVDIWDSLGNFAYVTRLNDLFWWIIEETIWPNIRQKNYQYNVVIVIAVILVSLVFFRNWRRGMLWVLGIALILSPVLHPWYCTWILPLAAWRRAQPWQVLSVTLFTYYLFWNERLFALPWHAELWMRGIIILPPLFATAAYLLRERDGPSTQPQPLESA